MKTKFKLFALAMFLSLPFLSQAQFSVGLGAMYNLQSGAGFAYGGRLMYGINEQIRLSGEYAFYASSTTSGAGYSSSVTETNLNVHYFFGDTKSDMKFYALGGLNIYTASVTFTGSGSLSASSTGVNLGVGGETKLSDALTLLGEAKYELHDGGSVVIGATVAYTFGGK